MRARSAAAHNPVIRAYVQGLCKRRKPFKCALVAAMRKLLIHLHSFFLKTKRNALQATTVADVFFFPTGLFFFMILVGC